MRIAEFLQAKSIVPELSGSTKTEVLQELSRSLVHTYPSLTEKRLVQVLTDREKLSSTGIGEGIAIPHAKLSELKQLLACFGVSRPGINFDAIDGKPTHLFFALVAPENSAGIHLKALARISRLFKSPQFRSALLEAKTGEQIYALITQEDGKA
ncbi:MAG TPA: PTS sugar transporter subunit IIA [Myxococcales bacterium]